MDPLIHTVIATGLIAASFYYGVYKGALKGFNKGIEETLSYLNDEQMETVISEIQRRKESEL